VATKVTKGRLAQYPSTALTFKLLAPGSDSVANGSGDSATTGANGSFSFDVTEAISGTFDVLAFEGSTLRGVGQVVYDSDTAGTYYVTAVQDPLKAGDIDGLDLEESLKIMLAVLAGRLSGAATTTVVIKAADNSKTRVTATVDSDGNRSALTLDATG